jgi:uncharacterized protein (TIGR01777 family)
MEKPILVVSGASGVVGKAIANAAKERYRIRTLTREPSGKQGVEEVAWNPRAAREGDDASLSTVASALEGARAVVNLAGTSLDNGRLDAKHRREVLESRIDSTTTLVAALKRLAAPPPVWLQASAVGYYGDRGDETLTEEASKGEDFALADICETWEAAAQSAREHSRLVITRFGLVLGREAPAWQKLLTPLKLGVAGPLGSGEQWWAWIHAQDLAAAALYLIENDASEGVYNVSAPEPTRQKALIRAAAARLKRPAVLPAPAPLLRLALGGVADALLLASTKAIPARLQAEGFTFRYPTLDAALDELLEKRP